MKIGRFISPEARAEFDVAYGRGFATLPQPDWQDDITTEFGTARVYRFGAPGPAPIVLLPAGRAPP